MAVPTIGMVFASGTGGFLAEVIGFRHLFVLASFLNLSMTTLRQLFIKEESQTLSRLINSLAGGLTYIRKASTSLKALFIFICSERFFTTLIFPQFFALFAQTKLELSRPEIGLFFTVFLTFSMIFNILGGKLADHYGRKKVIATRVLINPLVLISFTFTQKTVVFLLVAIGGVLQGVLLPSLQAIEADLIPRGLRGTLMGLFTATSSLIVIPTPIIWGYLWQGYVPEAPFYISAVFSATVLMIPLLFIEETLVSINET